MTDLSRPLLLIGGGKMGGALLEGWLARGLPPTEAHIVEPDAGRRAALAELGPVRLHAAIAELPDSLKPAALVLAVKPQVMDAVLAECRTIAGRSGFVLSIAAGKEIAGFERVFGNDRPIVRAMPNTPAAVGRGMSVLFANAACGAEVRAGAEALMAAVGEVAWIEDEELMHAVTAVSGSGPAYVFLLVEAMAAAGARLGLAPELAERLARRTVGGAGELLHRSPAAAAELRRAVTSPGGTTEAALRVLMRPDGLEALLIEAVAAAEQRSRELA